jgi:hypothetical protein
MRRVLLPAAMVLAFLMGNALAANDWDILGKLMQPVFNQGVGLVALTKSDTTLLVKVRALYIGDATACNVALELQNDTAAVTLTNVQPGEVLPLSAIRLMSTNTTCAAVVGIY